MRVALTGAAGFIGRQVRAALEARGDAVAASDIGDWNGVAQVDLRDATSVSAWIAAARPQAVIHAGAISGAMVAQDDPGLVHAVNVDGTANVLAGMAAAGVRRLVFLSSIAVYAPRQDRAPVDETSPRGSGSAYGRSKIAAEDLIGDAVAGGRITSAATLRISSAYGPRRRTPYLIGALPGHAATGLPVEVTDERCNLRQFVHVDDASRAVLLALDRAPAGFAAVNVTGGAYLGEEAIARIAARYLPGLDWRVVAHKEAADGDFGPLDLSRAKALLGYVPRVTIEEGLARLFAASGVMPPGGRRSADKDDASTGG